MCRPGRGGGLPPTPCPLRGLVDRGVRRRPSDRGPIEVRARPDRGLPGSTGRCGSVQVRFLRRPPRSSSSIGDTLHYRLLVVKPTMKICRLPPRAGRVCGALPMFSEPGRAALRGLGCQIGCQLGCVAKDGFSIHAPAAWPELRASAGSRPEVDRADRLPAKAAPPQSPESCPSVIPRRSQPNHSTLTCESPADKLLLQRNIRRGPRVERTATKLPQTQGPLNWAATDTVVGRSRSGVET